MPTKYRATIDTNEYRNRDTLKPGFVREFRRDSKAALAEVLAQITAELHRAVPCSGASARVEREDARGYCTQIVRYSGKGHAFERITCRTIGGRWTLEEWLDGSAKDGLPDFVDVGARP